MATLNDLNQAERDLIANALARAAPKVRDAILDAMRRGATIEFRCDAALLHLTPSDHHVAVLISTGKDKLLSAEDQAVVAYLKEQIRAKALRAVYRIELGRKEEV